MRSNYFQKLNYREEENTMPLNIFSSLGRQLIYIAIIFMVFAIGIAGIFRNSSYTLRIAIGSIFMLTCLRYRYALLIIWLLSIAAVGIFAFLLNNNIQTVLTVPTLLSMIFIPIKLAFRRMPALIFLLCFLLWTFAGIGISPIGMGPFLILAVSNLNCLAIAMLTICVITTKQRLIRLIDIILLGSACIALFGIYGYFTHQNGIGEVDSSQFRIISVFGSAPTLALFLSIVIPLAIYSTFISRGIKFYYSLLLVLILVGALGLTFSRTAFISTSLSLLIMLFFLPSRKMKIALFSSMILLAILTILLTTLFNFPIFDRFFSSDFATLNGRTDIWSIIINNFDPLQLLGKGLNASGVLVATLAISNGLGGIAAQAHNLFLGTLYDNGIIGLILLIGIFITLGKNLIVNMQKATGNHRALYAAALAIFINMVIQSLETSDLFSLGVGIYFWIIMALPFVFYWSGTDQ